METWVPPLLVAVLQCMMVGSCGCDVAVDVMSVVVDMSNLEEESLGGDSASAAGELAAELPPHVAAELSRPAFQIEFDVDLNMLVLTETKLLPKLPGAELDQEGATWKHDGSEKRWARLVDKNRHTPGLATT